MKQMIVGLFNTRVDAEEAINRLHNELEIPNEEISYMYRNTQGEMKETDAAEVSSGTPLEGATTGAAVGGAIAGVIPIIGPIIAAGPLVAALGLGAGAVGTAAAGAVTGAAAGGLIGVLTNWGVGESKAHEYEDNVQVGKVLVAVHAENADDVVDVFSACDASDVNVFAPVV